MDENTITAKMVINVRINSNPNIILKQVKMTAEIATIKLVLRISLFSIQV
jgi:hypothetical protein